VKTRLGAILKLTMRLLFIRVVSIFLCGSVFCNAAPLREGSFPAPSFTNGTNFSQQALTNRLVHFFRPGSLSQALGEIICRDEVTAFRFNRRGGWVIALSGLSVATFSAFRVYADWHHLKIRHFHNFLPSVMPRGSLLFSIDHGLLNDFLTALTIPALLLAATALLMLRLRGRPISMDTRLGFSGLLRTITLCWTWVTLMVGLAHTAEFRVKAGLPIDWGSLAAYVAGIVAAITVARLFRALTLMQQEPSLKHLNPFPQRSKDRLPNWRARRFRRAA
jgi:hypothetical protein